MKCNGCTMYCKQRCLLMGLFLAPPGAQVVALSVCLSVCLSVHYFYEFFTQSSVNLNAVSQLSSLLGVSWESLRSLLGVSLKSLLGVSFGSLFWESLLGVSRESLRSLSGVSQHSFSRLLLTASSFTSLYSEHTSSNKRSTKYFVLL